MDRDEIWAHTHRERRKLADFLETLSPEEWERPSLCEGWTVRDVATHVIRSAQVGLAESVVGMVRARGSFNRLTFADAKRYSARPVAAIIADYRIYDGSRHHPPGTSILDPLADVLVHTQDIALPLGRDVPMPPDASRAAGTRVWRMPFPHFARKRVTGHRLVATDTDWAVGEGQVVEAPMGRLLLVLTGRLDVEDV